MQVILPTNIAGELPAPASKSMMQRAIAIATLTKGTSLLQGYTPCHDSDTALAIAHNLGATVQIEGTDITITGGLNPRSLSLHCGEAGLGIRMFSPIASLWHNTIEISGEGSLLTRPVDSLVPSLTELGVRVETNNGFVPVKVTGPLKGGVAHVDGSLSSQILTGILIASPLAQKDVTLYVQDLKSIPYIDMTLQIMHDFGVNVKHSAYKEFYISTDTHYKARNYTVEGDWSGASFLLVAGALGGSVRVTNLDTHSKQADKALLHALEQAGAEITLLEKEVRVSHKQLRAFEFDATDCPDLFPPLVALAAHCSGTSIIKGASRLRHKESDRATVLINEFAKLGTRIHTEGDYMHIVGGTLEGGRMHANNDHRIAMAGAVAAIRATGAVEIENPECVAKSYPHFWEDFSHLCTL